MVASNFNPIFRNIQDAPDGILAGFSCGRDQLDEFLHEDAKNYADHGLTKTVIVFLEGFNGVAAYFSLSSDAVVLNESEKFALGVTLPVRSFPAVKITKLAIASALKRQKIGSELINFICGLVHHDQIATRLLTVDAVNTPEVLGFYEDTGFLHCLQEAKARQCQLRETILMFKDLFEP
jgi:ribosomal protein S18 acetylase RimI-like enzyme